MTTEHVAPLIIVANDGPRPAYFEWETAEHFDEGEWHLNRHVVAATTPPLGERGWAGHRKYGGDDRVFDPGTDEWWGWWHDEYEIIPLTEAPSGIKQVYWERRGRRITP